MAFRGCAPLAFRLIVADPNLPALDLVFPNDAFMAVRLALDAVLKRVARLGELSNDLVPALSSAIFTQTGRKSQGLPNGKFMGSHFLLQRARVPPCPAAPRAIERYSVWRLTAEVFPCCPRSSS
jgi:hypothetical protein